MFATCSDDQTICLWDLRNMSQRVCKLRGHSDMIKNVEFVPHKGIMVTSAFDGNVNTWDINWSVVERNDNVIFTTHHKGETESECIAHNFSLFAIFLPKIMNSGGNLTKF